MTTVLFSRQDKVLLYKLMSVSPRINLYLYTGNYGEDAISNHIVCWCLFSGRCGIRHWQGITQLNTLFSVMCSHFRRRDSLRVNLCQLICLFQDLVMFVHQQASRLEKQGATIAEQTSTIKQLSSTVNQQQELIQQLKIENQESMNPP